MARVVPSERFRRELDELLAGVDGDTDPVERIGRLGARLILQQALEDEVTEFLGRVRYERASDPVSHRNGYEPRRVVTTAGPVELERPRVRNARELGFESRILGKHVARTYALESLVICSFLRGLSVRDVEAALEETYEEPVIGKSTVAQGGQRASSGLSSRAVHRRARRAAPTDESQIRWRVRAPCATLRSVRVTDVAKSRRQERVACRAALPFEGL